MKTMAGYQFFERCDGRMNTFKYCKGNSRNVIGEALEAGDTMATQS